MKIKLKDLEKPMKSLYCFNRQGFCQTTFDNINSGKEVEVERVPHKAWDFLEEVKTIKKKQKKGSNPKGDK